MNLTYQVIREFLNDNKIAKLFSKIADSTRFDFDTEGLSHVVLAGTNICVGYIGSQTAELCIPEEGVPKNYRIPHSHLRRIFNSV